MRINLGPYHIREYRSSFSPYPHSFPPENIRGLLKLKFLTRLWDALVVDLQILVSAFAGVPKHRVWSIQIARRTTIAQLLDNLKRRCGWTFLVRVSTSTYPAVSATVRCRCYFNDSARVTALNCSSFSVAKN